MDVLKEHDCIWVCAPGGYGKTSLTSSYLEKSKAKALWYQLDHNDGDVSNFFHYLRQSAQQTLSITDELPVYSTEYKGSEELFALNFINEINHLIGSQWFLVLDNFQEIPQESGLHNVLKHCLLNMPPDLQLIVNSREMPSPIYARCIANENISVIGKTELSLTQTEALEICKLKSFEQISDENCNTLFRYSQGWVSALVLMLKNYQLSGSLDTAPDNVFDYFAEEVIKNSDKATQKFLMKTAFLPEITAVMADKITGQTNSESILEFFSQNNYFTTRILSSDIVYKYHDLFRVFLMKMVEKNFTAIEISSLKNKISSVLIENGDYETAVELLVDTCNWQRLGKLASEQAQTLFLQGRVNVIEKWLSNIPYEISSQNPWLLYWLGVSCVHYNPVKSRDYLAGSYKLFKQDNMQTGVVLSWAGVVDTYVYEWGDFSVLDYWIEEAGLIKQQDMSRLSPDISTRFIFAFFMALMYRQPDHPEMDQCLSRLKEIFQNTVDLHVKVMIGHHLVLYYTWWKGDMGETAMVLEWLRPVVEKINLSPMLNIVWLCMRANYQSVRGEAEECIRSVDAGLRIANESGVHLWDFMLYSQYVWGELVQGNEEKAFQYIQSMSNVTDQTRLMNVCLFHDTASIVAIRRGEIAQAKSHNATATDYANSTGMPFAQAMCYLTSARIASLNGGYEKSDDYIDQAKQIGERMGSQFIHFLCLLLSCVNDDEQGNESFIKNLQQTMAFGKKYGFYAHMWLSKNVLSRLCTISLGNNIENEYVSELIKKNNLQAKVQQTYEGDKVWPVKITTLGEFSVLIQSSKEYIDKTKYHKPLQLLQAIICLGGEDVPRSKLIELFWPDTKSKSAGHALTTNLYRLRKILKSESAVILSEGNISLNKDYCWLDYFAVQSIISEIENELLIYKTNIDEEKLLYSARMLQSLYKGKLFTNWEGDWVHQQQSRLHHKYLRIVKKMGTYLIDTKNWEEAIECYSHAEYYEPLIEEFYQQQMLCHLEMENMSEVLVVYRRCMINLSKGLAVAPSRKTELLRQKASNRNLVD
ncbi:MAG: hypothetical protein OEY52_11360 [Gammaproteobacteria bacterium]|nr:hypothetical protein [Gammaproteobacteria bacterium]